MHVMYATEVYKCFNTALLDSVSTNFSHNRAFDRNIVVLISSRFPGLKF